MNMEPWVIWLILGASLLVVEMLTLTMVLLFFGVTALAAAALAKLGVSWPAQLIFFAVVSLFLTFAARKPALKLITRTKLKNVAPQEVMVGKTGKVIETIDPVEGKGKVEIEGDIWTAVGSGEVIETGASIKVEEVVGPRLRVSRLH
ncbi:NfeD family protein [Desulforudis sp. 1088]|uniref:NfeD family protein n=2 Tax=Candidatus Desulforudis TaxID=471826 RepID=UPI003CEA6FCC